MKFTTIIFDLDGTAIPNKNEGMPRTEVIEAVKKAQEKNIKVTAATGRSISDCRNILKALNIDLPSVISGGTQIIDPKTEKTLWEKKLSEDQVNKILHITFPYSYLIKLGNGKDYTIANNNTSGHYLIAYIMNVTKEDTESIIKQLSEIPDISFHEVISWTKDHFDIHITHIEATKKHALEQLFKIIGVNKNEVIAVGDSNNDIPLFENAGYKVAMGNASDKLKLMADHVTSTVEEDGLVKVIEEKVLI